LLDIQIKVLNNIYFYKLKSKLRRRTTEIIIWYPYYDLETVNALHVILFEIIYRKNKSSTVEQQNRTYWFRCNIAT